MQINAWDWSFKTELPVYSLVKIQVCFNSFITVRKKKKRKKKENARVWPSRALSQQLQKLAIFCFPVLLKKLTIASFLSSFSCHRSRCNSWSCQLWQKGCRWIRCWLQRGLIGSHSATTRRIPPLSCSGPCWLSEFLRLGALRMFPLHYCVWKWCWCWHGRLVCERWEDISFPATAATW